MIGILSTMESEFRKEYNLINRSELDNCFRTLFGIQSTQRSTDIISRYQEGESFSFLDFSGRTIGEMGHLGYNGVETDKDQLVLKDTFPKSLYVKYLIKQFKGN